MIIVNIPDERCEAKSQSLISEIKNLSSDKSYEEPILISKIAANKKKKKKKKKGGFDEYKEIISEISESDTSEVLMFDVDDYINRKVESENIEDEIVGVQKGNYNKLKKEDNPFKKEFAEELTLLYNLLDETNKYNKKLEKQYDALESSKTRGVSKYTTDIAAAVLQGKSSKLHIIKEIVSVKKSIADLKIKTDNKNKVSSTEVSTELAASSYLQNIIKHGRSNFIDAMVKPAIDAGGDDNIIDALNPLSDDLGAYGKYEDVLEERLSNEVNKYRNSDDGDTYIRYENQGIKIMIKRNITDGEWELIAVDKNNQQVYDYPLPTKKDLGTMKFTDDGSYASDRYGRSYKVMEICE